MFTKVLIANRGEIAVRVIRACQEMGVATVAVYSDLDREALHVRLADEAFALGGKTAAESYLNTDAILNAIERSGADAVHPGYGFFSENADFARAISDRGVAFIGPPPEAIEVMGDKVSAREAAEKVDVHGVPGNTEFLTDAKQITDFGSEAGYPLAIKAAYGGGGRGMKVVNSAEEAGSALESARREALAYFGRDECYVERYLTAPRHIEIQVLCDQHGNGVHLSQRDCSAQRRHQKLIEEAPAFNLPADIAASMGDDAVKVALGCGYTNAGTVEFLYEDGAYFYLEMNTRLQVEHPVTEMVTGLDLVRLQLMVASGEPLPFNQEDVVTNGHAIEVRINAEDPAEGKFLPSPGPLTSMHFPSGYGVRWDGGYEQGDEISQFYDNLVGKLVCWGTTRDIAIARTLRALREFRIEGVATTIPADIAILEHPDFAAGKHSTKWVEETLNLKGVTGTTAPVSDPEDPKVQRNATVEVNGKRFDVAMWVPESQMGSAAPAKAAPRRKASGGGAAGGGSGSITAPMQGTIVKVLVEQGAAVEVGQTLVVLEAMKMENNITADKAGTVSVLNVEAGQAIQTGDVIAKIE
ncbi:MAG: acetyl-CoA carboxylase biotin carboxylase subunit [Acidimicrobiales bacterium]|nr:acetyl-CoA carboxylase biotin carboxylase subunit [Acidimicrobiales bacterium]